MSSSTSSASATMQLRHKCGTKYIGKVNQNLTKAQKEKIDATPFKWLRFLPEKINISGILLEELCRRWDEKLGAFRIQNRPLKFTPLDVCYAVGLGLVGEKVNVDDDITSYTLTLLEGTDMSLEAIYEKLKILSGDDNVDDFCRLYILLAMEEFYFPNASIGVTCRCIKLLDNLDSLGTFNWGLAVYDNLVAKLTKLSNSLVQSNTSTKCTYLMGCVVVLQVWGIEHIWPNHKKSAKVDRLFPWCLKWFDIFLDRKQIEASFTKNQVLDELSATKEERTEIDVVIQALNEAPYGYQTSRHATNEQLEAEQKRLEKRLSNVERYLSDLRSLPQSEREIVQRKIDELQLQLEEVKHAQEAKDLDPIEQRSTELGHEPSEIDLVYNDREVSHQAHKESNMLTRRRNNPRKVMQQCEPRIYTMVGKRRRPCRGDDRFYINLQSVFGASLDVFLIQNYGPYYFISSDPKKVFEIDS